MVITRLNSAARDDADAALTPLTVSLPNPEPASQRNLSLWIESDLTFYSELVILGGRCQFPFKISPSASLILKGILFRDIRPLGGRDPVLDADQMTGIVA
jgi:hypothetical protein